MAAQLVDFIAKQIDEQLKSVDSFTQRQKIIHQIASYAAYYQEMDPVRQAIPMVKEIAQRVLESVGDSEAFVKVTYKEHKRIIKKRVKTTSFIKQHAQQRMEDQKPKQMKVFNVAVEAVTELYKSHLDLHALQLLVSKYEAKERREEAERLKVEEAKIAAEIAKKEAQLAKLRGQPTKRKADVQKPPRQASRLPTDPEFKDNIQEPMPPRQASRLPTDPEFKDNIQEPPSQAQYQEPHALPWTPAPADDRPSFWNSPPPSSWTGQLPAFWNGQVFTRFTNNSFPPPRPQGSSLGTMMDIDRPKGLQLSLVDDDPEVEEISNQFYHQM